MFPTLSYNVMCWNETKSWGKTSGMFYLRVQLSTVISVDGLEIIPREIV